MTSRTAAAVPPGPALSHAAFVVMREAALAAERSAGGIDRWYQIGGSALQIRFAGPALLSGLSPALDHLASRPVAGPDLLVRVWDSASTGIDVPPGPRARTAGPDDDGARLYAVFQPDPTSLSLFAPGVREAIYWVPDGRTLTVHQRAAPLRPILYWWLRERRQQLAHGGAVAAGPRGILLAGASGCGKSTTAVACLLSGLDYLGDDYVLLADEAGPTVHSLYNSAKLNPDHARVFPGLVSRAANPLTLATEKALWFVHDVHPERLRPRAAVRAVVVPRVAHTSLTRVTPITSAAALLALAPSTIAQLTGAGDDALRFIAGYVRQLPCYRLELGRDPAAIADAVRTVLDR